VAVVGAAIVLSAFAVSGSSLATLSTTGAPDENAIVTGEVRTVRADEYIAISPIKVGQARAGFPSPRTFGLGAIDTGDSWRPQIPSRSPAAALFAPFNLPLVVLPVAQGFALYWWLPFVGCALGLFAWLRLLGVGRGVAFAASVVTTASPAAVWWSGWMCQVIAQAVVPCAVLLVATRLWTRRRGLAVAVAVAAGLAAASLPWAYQPWSVPAALSIGGITAIWGLASPIRRRPFLYVAAVAAGVVAVESAVYLLHERSYYEALASTVYPGERREVGGGVRIGKLLSSLFPFALSGDSGNSLMQENLSEVSMGWTITAPVALFTAMLGRNALRRDPDRVLLWGSLAVTALISAWCLIRWPRALATVTLLTFSPAPRTAPFVGLTGTVSLALLLGTKERRENIGRALGRSGVLLVAAATMFVAAWGATDFRLTFVNVSEARLILAVLVVGALVVLLFTRWSAIAVGVSLAVVVVSAAVVNPLMHGLGELADSPAAAAVRRINGRVVAPAHGTWAADSIYADALLNGQGLNSLSSYNDPVDEDAWRILDPRRAYEPEWNRFGYIIFEWQDGAGKPVITNPAPDMVAVKMDPCDARLSRLHMRAILSSKPLSSSCLTKLDDVEWQGTPYSAYRIASHTR
jgi:hypothetical protein